MNSFKARTVGQLKEVLFGGGALPPDEEVVYYVILKPGENTTVIRPVMLGEEYPKTYGHFHEHQTEEKYFVAYGEGLLILQEQDGLGTVSRFTAKAIRQGQLVTIPGFAGHCLVNVRQSPLITIDNSSPDLETNDYEPIKSRHGFAYYFVTDQRGGWRAIPNPYYQDHPAVVREA